MQLKAIIFDWAGTVVDFGSLCPVEAFRAAFAERAVEVSIRDVQRFMGIRKREHIQSILNLPAVSARWWALQGRGPNGQDLDELYERAEHLLIETVTSFATPIPHALEAVEQARKLGLKIGSSTGYTSPMMERLAPAARKHGYRPDFWVASDQVAHGRPWPWMIFRNMEHLQVCPPATVVKVGDTVADVEEAKNAGVWSVAVVESSSVVGKSPAELETLTASKRRTAFQHARTQLAEAGAHFVINNLSELDVVLEQIGERLDKGQNPPQLNRRRKELV